MEKLFIPYTSYVNKKGVKITKYKPNPKLGDIKIKSINLQTGKIEYKKILEFSKHENINMYKIEPIFDIFQPFYASDDHSLIVFDKNLCILKKESPVNINKEKDRYFLVIQKNTKFDKNILNFLTAVFYMLYIILYDKCKTLFEILKEQNVILFPCSLVKIVKDETKTVGYDFTVEDNFTFSTFDGVFVQDTMGIYFVDSKEAKEEAYKNKIHILYQIKNLQNDSYMHKLRHELLYAMYIITSHLNADESKEKIIVSSLDELEIDFNLFEKLDTPVFIKNLNKTVSYGIAIVNKILFEDKILINEKIDKTNVQIVNEKLYKFICEKYKDLPEIEKNKIYFDKLHELVLFLSSFLTCTNFNPYIHEKDYMTYKEIEKEVENLPDEPILGEIKFKKLVDKTIEKMKDEKSVLYNIYISGSRASKDQIKQVVVARGYIANDRNIVLKKPIKSNLMQGLSEEELFVSSFGARKGLVDKTDFTPVSGYLERTMVMNSSFIDTNKFINDCKTKNTLNIKVFSELHALSLIGRYVVVNGKLVKITKKNYKEFINKKIKLRSPIYCKCKKYKVCRICSGDFGSIMNLGMASGQFISERFTQLTLRTFHISAVCNLDIPQELFNIVNPDKIVKNKYLGTKEEILLINKVLKEYLKDSSYFVYIDEEGNIHSKGILINKDIITTIKHVKSFFTKTFTKVTADKGILSPELVYTYIMKEYLKHGFIKSLYLEIVLSHLWVHKETLKPIRYLAKVNYKNVMKVSLKKAGEIASKLLYLLYEPNKKSILKYITENEKDIETPYHKLIKF